MPFRLPTPVLIALLGLAFATLIGLGVWQLQRNSWRNELVAERNAQMTGQPLTTAEALSLAPEALDYRLVSVTGSWDAQHVMVLANRARYGIKGENVVQPLVIAPGRAVLVDRGWYPAPERDAVLARLAAEGPQAEVRGLARYVEDLRGTRTPAGTWTGIDPQAMAEGLPTRLEPWFVIQGDILPDNPARPTTYPAQGFVRYASPVPHIEYALTWFGIAAALAVIAVLRLVVQPRRERARADAAAHFPGSR